MAVSSKFLAGLTVVACGAVALPLPVQAGAIADWKFIDDGSGAYAFGVDVDFPEAVAVAPSSYECVTTDVTGTSETQFTVSITANEKYTPDGGTSPDDDIDIDVLGDLVDCFQDYNPIGPFSLDDQYMDYFPLAGLFWIDFDGPGGPPFVYQCLRVSATDGDNAAIDSIAAFPTEMGGGGITSLDEISTASIPGLSWGRGTFVDSPVFYSIMLFDDSDLTDTDLTWDFEFTVSACGGVETPRIDLDHYRRRAEQAEASALPDTL